MSLPSRLVAALAALMGAFLLSAPADAQQSEKAAAEKRIALVVGNAAYEGAPLATTANDAGLVAQTLQAAGFDVVGARDLDEESLRRALRDFLDKATASGPETVAFVYLAGYGLQLEGETFFAPVDARIPAAVDVPVSALRVSDYIKRLSTVPLKARFVVLDAARANPFVKTGEPLAGGLALVEAEPGSLIAYNAAPGTVAPPETGAYGAYAQALVEMIREGGLQPAPLFDRVRLRVNETTKGAAMPWDDAKIEAPFVFFERSAEAPVSEKAEQIASLRDRPLRDIGARDAYSVAVERDTLQGYQDFLGAYPDNPMAKRVRAIVAARREALTWRRAWSAGTQDAYWTYLTRYPRGPHAADARRRLARLSAPPRPPEAFTALSFDLPPPPPEEEAYFGGPVLAFDDPAYDLPPPPLGLLAPRPAYIVAIAPPPPEDEEFALPVPAFVPVPLYVSAPAYIVAPPDNVIYQNIHNTVVINEINRRAIERPRGPSAAVVVGGAAALGAAALAARVALPPSLSHRAGRDGDGSRRDRPGMPPAARDGRPNDPRFGRPLPGVNEPVSPSRTARPDAKGVPGATGIADPRSIANTRRPVDAGGAADRRNAADAARPSEPRPARGMGDPTDRAALHRERIERRDAARAAGNGRPGLDRARDATPDARQAGRPGFERNRPERVRPDPTPQNREAFGQQQRQQAQEARQQQRMQMEQQRAAQRQQMQGQQQMMQRQQMQEARQQQQAAQRQQMQAQQQMMQRQQMQAQQQAQRQQIQAQQQQQAAQRQQMMQQQHQQQQAAQRQPRQAPASGGNPNCHPGRPCR